MTDTPRKLVALRYGKGYVDLRVPVDATILESQTIDPLPDPPAALRQALAQPIGCDPLGQIVQRKQPRTIAITISDITRPVPNELIVTGLLDELNTAGIGDHQIIIIIATGMHRASTPAERLTLLGQAILNRIEVIDHEADRSEMVRVCDDPPVGVNRRFFDADMRLVTGLIEPHFMAGFSGGRKGICPGLVDLNTVQRFHGYAVMADPNTVEGRLAGNPCHEESLRVAQVVGCDFLVNCAITLDRQPAAIWAGDMVDAHLVGCEQVARWNTAHVDKPFDLVITNAGGYPLDESFYQTGKGIVTALPALHEQSTLIILSHCHELGSPEFTEQMMRFGRDHHAFLEQIKNAPHTEKDQWQYQMHTRVLERIGVSRLMLANDDLPADTQARLPVTPLPGSGPAPQRIQAYLDRFITTHPQARIAVIPEGPYTMLGKT